MKRLSQIDQKTHDIALGLVDNVSTDEIYAVTDLVRALAVAGAVEQAIALLEMTIINVPLDDPGNLALLLSTVRLVYVDEEVEERVDPLLARDPSAHVSVDNLASVAELIEQLRLGHGLEQAMNLASRTAAEARLDEVDGVCRTVEIMHRLGAARPLAVLLARDPASSVPLNDLLDLAKLLTSLHKAGAEEQVAAVSVRITAVPVERDNLDALQTLVEELWESGSKEQATALAYRAATCASPDDPEASVLVARMLETVEVEEFTSALLSRCPTEYANLTEPAAVFALLDALQEDHAEIDVLLERDPATSIASMILRAWPTCCRFS